MATKVKIDEVISVEIPTDSIILSNIRPVTYLFRNGERLYKTTKTAWEIIRYGTTSYTKRVILMIILIKAVVLSLFLGVMLMNIVIFYYKKKTIASGNICV